MSFESLEALVAARLAAANNAKEYVVRKGKKPALDANEKEAAGENKKDEHTKKTFFQKASDLFNKAKGGAKALKEGAEEAADAAADVADTAGDIGDLAEGANDAVDGAADLVDKE